jgi:TolB-like protein
MLGKDEMIKAVWPDSFVEEGNLSRNISTLRAALGESAEDHQYIETVPKRGYRFVASVKELIENGGLAVESAPTPGKASKRPSDAPAVPKTVGMMLFRSHSRQIIESVAVLPFVNATADEQFEHLSDGITESIINSLSHISELQVMARSTVFRYKGKDASPREVGRELKVNAVVTGRVLQFGGRLRIATELVDVADGKQLWGEQYNRRPSDILEVQAEISKEIAEKLRLRLTGEQKERLVKRHTDSSEAYHFYLKGRYYWNKRTAESLKKAVSLFERAIHTDETYALAHAGLADSYMLIHTLPPLEVMPKARVAALKALEIDDTLAEAHCSLAKVEDNYVWDWSGAEREYQRAIELNPNYATARQWYAEHLAAMGRHEEGIAEISRAQEVDPLSLSISNAVARQFYFARQFDEAIEQCRRTLEMEPHFLPAHYRLGGVYLQKQMYEEAISEYEMTVEISGGESVMIAGLAYAYAAAGKRKEAENLLDDLLKLSTGQHVEPTILIQVYAALGKNDRALECLEATYAGRYPLMIYLKVDPGLDNLRSDPRFQDLMQRVGLPQ